MQNEKNIRDALRAVLEKLIEVAPTAEQEWPELVRRAKDALASGDIDPAWAGVCAACAEGMPPERCAYYGEPDGCNAPARGHHPAGDVAERLKDELADAHDAIARLEAELAEARRERDTACAERALSAAPGNAAALREALEGCMHEMCERCDSYMADNMQTHKPCPGCVIVDKARAALSAPARNCDRFADVLRASEAYEATKTDLPFEEWLFSTEKGKETDNG